jgi:hypothetical protein
VVFVAVNRSIKHLCSTLERRRDFSDANADAPEPLIVIDIGLFFVLDGPSLRGGPLDEVQKAACIIAQLDNSSVDVEEPQRVTLVRVRDFDQGVKARPAPNFGPLLGARTEALCCEDVAPLVINETFQDSPLVTMTSPLTRV